MKLIKKLVIGMVIIFSSLIVFPSVIPMFESSYTVQAASTVKINIKSKTLNVNEAYTLKITGTKKKVTWSSSDKSVATINSNGKVTAKKKGTATITAKVGNKKYICKIKVENPKISATSKKIDKGSTYTLKITGSTQKITWSSSDKNIATVNSNGKVTAKKKGTVTITAKVGSKKYNCKITVVNVSARKANAKTKAKEYLKYMAFSYDGLLKQLKNDGFTQAEAKYGVDTCGANWNKQAIRKAKEYLDCMAFSYNGLVKQLKYEGFTAKQAKYGVDNCGANWNKQAIKMAKEYLRYSAFSYSGLINQLEFEGFTAKQAKYGVNNCGANWNKQAAKKAKQYMSYYSLSKKDLTAQLKYDGFTTKQINYGVKSVGY